DPGRDEGAEGDPTERGRALGAPEGSPDGPDTGRWGEGAAAEASDGAVAGEERAADEVGDDGHGREQGEGGKEGRDAAAEEEVGVEAVEGGGEKPGEQEDAVVPLGPLVHATHGVGPNGRREELRGDGEEGAEQREGLEALALEVGGGVGGRVAEGDESGEDDGDACVPRGGASVEGAVGGELEGLLG